MAGAKHGNDIGGRDLPSRQNAPEAAFSEIIGNVPFGATVNANQLAEWEAWQGRARQFDINTRVLCLAEAISAIPSVERQCVHRVGTRA